MAKRFTDCLIELSHALTTNSGAHIEWAWKDLSKHPLRGVFASRINHIAHAHKARVALTNFRTFIQDPYNITQIWLAKLPEEEVLKKFS